KCDPGGALRPPPSSPAPSCTPDMFRPVTLFVALRYLRSKRRNRFAGFVSLVSVSGIALGVAALVIVLSVMNGFEREVSRHVLGMSAHALALARSGHLDDWRTLLEAPVLVDSVAAAAPFVRGSGMVSRRGEVRGVLVEGILPDAERATTALASYVDTATLATLVPGSRRAILGSVLAAELGLAVGDPLTLMLPDWDRQGRPRTPRYVRLEVGGVFHVGMHQYDSRLLLLHLADAQAVLGTGDGVSGLRLRFADAAIAPQAARALVAALDRDLTVVDWTQYHRNFFLALASQKRIMFVILILIVAVAAFNIAANMVMMVSEKVRDIAILRTLGATPARIVRLFLLQGLFIGLAGALLGGLLGAWGAAESEAAARFIEGLLGIDLINADVYFIDYLPAELRARDVIEVTAAAVGLAVLATVYPALRAAAIDPARAVHRD
ncbi:MAG: lipoprotein-releasing ABC transporter permease subunit, partial [Gammaproteobacteria bacterium]